jgi:predicted dinucleotide-utilizing enzyme
VPSDENPGTGRITALSMLAALERLASPIVFGT